MLTGVFNSILLAPQRIFASRGGAVVDNCPPPSKPTPTCSIGGYCIKATCDILDENGNEAASIIGYDTRGDIAERVVQACEWRKKKNDGQTCGPVRLAMLPGKTDFLCSGQVYFKEKGSDRKMISSG